MISKLNILLPFLFLLLFINSYCQNKMKYNKDIVVNEKVVRAKKVNVCDEKIDILQEDLNLNFIESKKRVKRFGMIPFQRKKDEKIHNYIYGKKFFHDFTMFLYSNEYNPWKDDKGILSYGKIEGFLVIIKRGKVLQYIKVFDSELDNELFLKSFLFDNYVIIIQIIDHGYDLLELDENNKIIEELVDYSFSVVELKKQGKIKSLNEKKGREIARKYLSKYEEYKGKF